MTVHIASHRAPEHFMPFQKELCFDDELVLQQLRYTGMLETVRIRRSGYSAKYTFQVGRPHPLPLPCRGGHRSRPGKICELNELEVSSRFLD